MPSSPGAALRMRTRTSYHAAWPVTGSELEKRMPSASGGSSSLMSPLIRKPRRASSAPGARFQAPGALPIAFQVHTVPGSTASDRRATQRTLPQVDSTQIQSPSRMPCADAAAGFTNRLLWPWIWRSQAFCESHEWYIAIGRCVTAERGKRTLSVACASRGS